MLSWSLVTLLWPRGLCVGGKRGRSFQSILRERLFWTNLYIQVREVEPRKTVICPESQVIFTLL